MKVIIETASKVKIGSPTTFRNLMVFPLLAGNGTAADYLTLDEALSQKCATITEVSEGGSVPELRFANSSGKRIFLLDGEELVGAKQNRVLNLSILVPAGKTIVIPVSCVEAGRWHHRSREFSSAPRAHYAEGRARKMAQVSESMRSSGRRTSNQGEVWRDISEKFSKFGSSSPTSAMSDIYEQQAGRLEEYVRSFTPAAGQVGAVFIINGKIVGLDLFDFPETFQKLLPKLLRSYGLDALDRAGSASVEAQPLPSEVEVDKFLKEVMAAEAVEFPAIGQGQDLRLTSSALTGAALAADDRVVHLSAFAT